MQTLETSYFNPNWRDDVFNIQAINMSLALPEATPRNNSVWVDVQSVHSEKVFGQQHIYTPYRLITSILKPSNMAQYYTVQDEHGHTISADDSIMATIFPAKAWMSDSGEERCMMFAAAKIARGHILVGGLGLGIYPQFVLALNRPVKSLTILERDPKIIDFVTRAWLQPITDPAINITILEGTIEDYLSQTDQTFDTIYLDTWEDADPRFLAHVNYLISLAAKHCSTGGTVQCWGYAQMINTFTENVKVLTQKKFPWHEYQLDPLLQAYANWLERQKSDVPEAVIAQAAKTFALTIQQPLDTYERHRCFTAFGTSLIDTYQKIALSQDKG
ncbi:class I SAM-dependent methyltransferase [Leptolyngbya cf. ectocarpi LEGE 11479]|uniref:Class I SAM-dependent methyltransferase n=1 Tax=Leptolyngbya cf. ectocarpi LEGE 11479 TaxID=1828722 RepID=A0A929A0J5_LEPEC|nr:class I SAM-dependent methyltransferase [Leptolyngbya ectocarpi]MBE9070952.1 class I SAM-dependent methyltransferase [Leptolyngbya cf. ectocarpi LEGE 11479]